MSVVMRIIQQYDPVHEKEFWDLEQKFAWLEKRRPDYPKGRRLKPISAAEPCNTLVWEGEFPDLEAARGFLDFCSGDEEHEELFTRQAPFFRQVKVEFYEKMDRD